LSRASVPGSRRFGVGVPGSDSVSRDLRRILREVDLPRPDREHALAIVRAAFADRERVSWPRRHVRSLAVVGVAAVVVAGALSPPGQAVLGSLRDAVGREGVKRASPALVALPAPGRLLVQSPGGPWIVQADGSRRLLGAYDDSAWSPHGLFVAATRRSELDALDPHGRVRWALARPQVRFPRWAGSRTNTQIAYLTGSRLHVVAGDGSHDVDLCGGPAAARVAPAWHPGPGWTLAYSTTRGRVYVWDAGHCSLLWRSAPFPKPRLLQWSSDGRRLALVTADKLVVFSGEHPTVRYVRGVSAVAFAPGSHRLAVVQGGRLLLFDADRLTAPPQRIFSGAGRFGDVAWSPDGRWLVISWPSADQLLFIRSTGVRRLLAFSNVTEQFGGRGFPRLRGWCC
jgi:WD40-like Beta Propeller Repeat